jgi:hypothetical protein
MAMVKKKRGEYKRGGRIRIGSSWEEAEEAVVVGVVVVLGLDVGMVQTVSEWHHCSPRQPATEGTSLDGVVGEEKSREGEGLRRDELRREPPLQRLHDRCVGRLQGKGW